MLSTFLNSISHSKVVGEKISQKGTTAFIASDAWPEFSDRHGSSYKVH